MRMSVISRSFEKLSRSDARKRQPALKAVLTLALAAALLLGAPVAAHAGSPRRDAPAKIGPAQVSGAYIAYLPGVFTAPPPPEDGWPMAAANPARTSWTAEEVTGALRVDWYRPIEAYIPQNAQVIASNGRLFIATARGLIALSAEDGSLLWRYDTELPLGGSPTVSRGVVYAGGYDRRLHAIDARTGARLWVFDGAKAGYDTNPLVVENKVILGNRDGAMYAIGAHGTPEQGRLVWRYTVGAPIHLSAAYHNGVIYFAAADNHAYALRAASGSLVWKSARLPGDGYHSYWPVVAGDKIIFSAASGYRTALSPGTLNVAGADGYGYQQSLYMDRDDLFPGAPDGTLIGPVTSGAPWAGGFSVIDVSRIAQYLENNPAPHPNLHKPWRRTLIVLNAGDGSEYTFDSDGDGYGEHIPVAYWGTQSGNRYPPIYGPDGLLYVGNIYEKRFISQGRVMGWNIHAPTQMKLMRGQGAVDEPQSISGGGTVIYRSIAVDRVGDWFSISVPTRTGVIWSYSQPLFQQAPGYDVMWWGPNGTNDPDRFRMNYGGLNGIYDNGGVQNPIVPYRGRLYIHRSNAVIAFGRGNGPGQLPLLRTVPATDTLATPGVTELKARLADQVARIVQTPTVFLKPGYYNAGQFNVFRELADYFNNPGETLYTLSIAYPHLPADLQAQVRSYLQAFFAAYFNPVMYARVGWVDGAQRENVLIPPEVQAAMAGLDKRTTPGSGWTWSYPQFNFYAMWKYAQVAPEHTLTLYELAKSKLHVPVPASADNAYFTQRMWELNGWIAGYIGFLRLQELAGRTQADAALRAQVQTELNRLLSVWETIFTKDTPWIDLWHKRHLNFARSFIMLTPELGEYARSVKLAEVRAALDEYNQVGPYWFVARYEAVMDEGVMSNLYNSPALFQARAFILGENRSQLTRYLDAPAFLRGDLFYIQNLVAAIEAPPGPNVLLDTDAPEAEASSVCDPSCEAGAQP